MSNVEQATLNVEVDSPKAPAGAAVEAYAGEVIESSTSRFLAESRELNGAPAFGSFVKTDSDPATFGLVCNVSTHSIEPNRRSVPAIPHGGKANYPTDRQFMTHDHASPTHTL